MPVIVIYFFEEIDITYGDADGIMIFFFDQFLKILISRAPVEKPRQFIGISLALKLVVVFDELAFGFVFLSAEKI